MVIFLLLCKNKLTKKNRAKATYRRKGLIGLKGCRGIRVPLYVVKRSSRQAW